MKTIRPWAFLSAVVCYMLAGQAPSSSLGADDGVYVRFRMSEPDPARYYVRLAGYIHKSPWYLPKAVIPEGADREPEKRVEARRFTPWFDLAGHAGDRFHGRLSRAGGVAEFPNVTAEFAADPPNEHCRITVELATAPDAKRVVKRFEESFRGSKTSFLVSPHLAADADHLETAAQMTERRLRWAREAAGGKAVSPEKLIVQTSFWAPQREELNLKEAEVLRLLGFNVVGNQSQAVREKSLFHVPGHTHSVSFAPGVTREEVDAQIRRAVERLKHKTAPGVPFGFRDEITSPTIGESRPALDHFHEWLAKEGIDPRDLGASRLAEVVPIETPDQLRERQEKDRAAANRVFYFTSRFRQQSTTRRLRWLADSLHAHLGDGPLTSTLVADHPYFSGTGLGMGMGPNPAWGRPALAADWFDLARQRAVDLAGIEDWMGLQYMYGPNFTWEGFQLMGFQAAIFRSGSRGRMPIIAWITPSDETNLRLKSASALCQGAKNFFYWTYGPTATSTENYWSDLESAYDGIVAVTRQLAAAEHVLAPGKPRKARVALLYSISSDLWQPFGYVHMLERRGTYLALVHDHYLVDMLTEEDVDAGRLDDYDVLYTTDPCIKKSAAARITRWVADGGYLYGTCAAGSRNEFGEPHAGLSEAFGIGPEVETRVQPGRYHVRGALNEMDYLDDIRLAATDEALKAPSIGVIGVKAGCTPAGGRIVGTFRDGSPAAVRHEFGRGKALYVGACPAIAYIKDARFVPRELREKWPPLHRRVITGPARDRGVRPLVELSHPVVEVGVYDSPEGTAVILANFTYEPIDGLEVGLPVPRPVEKVCSCEQGELPFTLPEASEADRADGYPHRVKFHLRLGLNDVILIE
ncbi:MAG: hypothetical protein ACYTG0_02095 [Planctomycetota bacterium]|jgi:hypothetical protein